MSEVNPDLHKTESQVTPASRRNFLKVGGALALGAGAAAIAACTTGSDNGAAAGPSTTSLLDKWIADKKATFGVDLTSPPMQFKDAQGNPTGYNLDLLQTMLKDLNVTPSYVELPFGQLVAAQAAGGKFDMIGLTITATPARAQQGLFCNFPALYESVTILLKPGSKVTKPSDLNAPGVIITALQGSSQEFSAKDLFPKATVKPFAQVDDGRAEVAAGRADATITGDFSVPTAIKTHPELKLLPGPPLYVDFDTWFVPAGDYKLQAWLTNWLRYRSSHGTMSAMWDKWAGNDLREQFNLQTAVVGYGGEAVVQDENGVVVRTY